jgi:hypothetical protein
LACNSIRLVMAVPCISDCRCCSSR